MNITSKDLDTACTLINKELGHDVNPHDHAPGTCTVEFYAGKYALDLVMENHGRKHIISLCKKSELHACMLAYLAGIKAGKASVAP